MVLPLGRPGPTHVTVESPLWTSGLQIIQNVDVLDLLNELHFYSTLPPCEHCVPCFTVASVWIDKALHDLLVSQHKYHRLGTPHLTLWLRPMRFQTDPLFLYSTFMPYTMAPRSRYEKIELLL